jgi:hypothetical protein
MNGVQVMRIETASERVIRMLNLWVTADVTPIFGRTPYLEKVEFHVSTMRRHLEATSSSPKSVPFHRPSYITTRPSN